MSALTRDQAAVILATREGYSTVENSHVSAEALIRAALAPEGQPCADCEQLVVYRDDDWHHIDGPTNCFLARKDERGATYTVVLTTDVAGDELHETLAMLDPNHEVYPGRLAGEGA